METEQDNWLTDAAGTRHSAPSPHEAGRLRIVSLVPSITELLFDLGLGKQVVGRTTFCVHPAAKVRRIPRVGGTKTVRLDRLLALQPTHVVVNIDENLKATASAIAEAGPTLVVTHPQSPEDNVTLYRLMGAVFGRWERAQELVTRFAHSLSALQSEATDLPPRQVLYLIWRDPWMSVARDTYISRMLAQVGWHTLPATSEARYPEVDLASEEVRGADLVLLSSEPYPFKARHLDEVAAAMTAQDPGGAAGHDGPKVTLIDGEMLSWYGSRVIDGLGYLGRFARSLGAPTGRGPAEGRTGSA